TVPRPPPSTLFPYTTLFRSGPLPTARAGATLPPRSALLNCGCGWGSPFRPALPPGSPPHPCPATRVGELRVNCGWGRLRGTTSRSEEHTSELQSRENLVCRL